MRNLANVVIAACLYTVPCMGKSGVNVEECVYAGQCVCVHVCLCVCLHMGIYLCLSVSVCFMCIQYGFAESIYLKYCSTVLIQLLNVCFCALCCSTVFQVCGGV